MQDTPRLPAIFYAGEERQGQLLHNADFEGAIPAWAGERWCGAALQGLAVFANFEA